MVAATLAVGPLLAPSDDPAAAPAAAGTSRDVADVTSASWITRNHGGCCEGNMAAGGSAIYVNAPRCTPCDNSVYRSTDGGDDWDRVYPAVGVPTFGAQGIEGDVRAWKDHVVFFGTVVSHGVAAVSHDRGDSWTTSPVVVPWAVNDQAWSYLGPVQAQGCPAQSQDYVVTGWFRIGAVAAFSCDGGTTWPVQTPLPAAGGGDSIHPLCTNSAGEPSDQGDTRVADADFAHMKAGRHGGWGTDGRFYWTRAGGDSLTVCWTSDLGATWEGVRHDVDVPSDASSVTTLAFDQQGTLYILYGDKLLVSVDRGHSFEHVHTLPLWGTGDGIGDDATQWFAVDDGDLHAAVYVEDGEDDDIVYVHGRDVDTASPTWTTEHVQDHDDTRLDFLQLSLNADDIPTVGYTYNEDVVTSSRTEAP